MQSRPWNSVTVNHWNSKKAADVFWNRQSLKFSNIHRISPVLSSLFNKVADLRTCNFPKKDTPTQVFHVDITKFLRTAFFKEHLRWLLLAVLPQYSKVSWGVYSLISRLHVLLNLIKNLHKALHKSFFTITWRKNWFDWLITCFRFHNKLYKTIVDFNFDETFTQSVVQSAV